jgi:hypothetical protein
LRIDELNNLCGLVTMVAICNWNDEITCNTNWEFWSRNGGLDCFRITYIRLNADYKIVQVFKSLIIFVVSIIWWKLWNFFCQSFFYYNTWKQFEFIGITFDYVILCFVIFAFCFLNFLCVRF